MPNEKIFTERNESFVCENCGTIVTKNVTTSRDHCTECLYGKHVDYNPGDRLQRCKGLLKPIGLKVHDGKQQIVYACMFCGERRFSLVQSDDNYDEIILISQKPW